MPELAKLVAGAGIAATHLTTYKATSLPFSLQPLARSARARQDSLELAVRPPHALVVRVQLVVPSLAAVKIP